MKKNTVKLNESQLRSMVMEVTRQALKDMKGATKDVHAKANEQSPEEKKYNRATSKPKPSHWKPLDKNDYENMRNGNVDGLSDKAVNMLHATMNNDDKAYRKAKYGELKEDTNMDTPKFDNVDNDTYLEAKRIINGKPFNDVANLPSVDERFSYGSLNGGEGEGLVDLNFKDILVTVRNENGVANIVSYEQYDENDQFDDLIYINEHKRKNTIKLNEAQLREIISSVIMESLGKEGIHIKEKNRGKFTATKERTGKSTEELTHSKNPLTKKRAIFAQNAKKWNKKK